MLAIGICVAAFISCYLAGRRSLGWGLVALLFFGYMYGIVRANVLSTFSHFIFDAGLLGLYLSPCWRTADPLEKRRTQVIEYWVLVLILWPFLLVALPFQPLLVSLVGLRGNTYFIPLLLFGARLKGKDIMRLAAGLAVLDLMAVGFATAEYFTSVEQFFPFSPVTLIMYASNDAGGGHLRIPATFVNAHAFGGTMVATMPFLIGLWMNAQKNAVRLLAMTSIGGALVGVLMSATRVNFITACAMVTFALFTIQMKPKYRFLFLLIVAGVAVTALGNVRLQRFETLNDTSVVTDRIAGSVNRNFWEILSEYPMGNGLGGGGTSIPYFLEGQVRNPIGMEDEYARILCEQGIIGLLLWLSFFAWFFTRGTVAFSAGQWSKTRKLVWCLTVLGAGTATLGTGMLTAIPGTVLFMIGAGWVAVRGEYAPVGAADGRARPMRTVEKSYA